MDVLTAKTFFFGEFKIDGAKRLLLKQGQGVSLNPKAFEMLFALVENHGQVLSKDELLEKVWAGQFVEENNLTVHISALRKILGEKKGANRFILTIPGRGYSFVAEVRDDARNSLVKTENSIAAAGVQNDDNFDEREGIIGRAADIAEIKNLLLGQNKCLITLTGAGGSGKTRLARTIAEECRAEFEGGVFFIELAAVNRAELCADAIAKALDVKESSDRSPLDALKDLLRERSILLVLDNFEQLLSAANLLKELLDFAANLKILVTSRAPLRLKIEQEKVVLPLDIPPRNSNLSAAELTAYASVELFAVRARETKPNFALTEENAPIIAEICGKLDGLPLAIELAAVRVKLLSPQAILARLEHSLQLLTGGAKDLPSRQRTMRGAIEWSYELLDAEEKFLFRRLAVFSGGFTVEAAETVGSWQKAEGGKFLSDDGKPPTEILDLITSLIDNNLLVSKEQVDGNARLQMLEVVREFAFEILRQTGEIDVLRRAHAEYFLALAEEAEPYLFSGQSIEWLEKLETEHDNLRAALRWMLEQEPEMAARTAAALSQFWTNRSYLTEARRWLEAALEKSGNAPIATRFKLLNSFALVARHQGDYAATRRASEESLAASRAANDLPQIILSCHAVAALETREGNFTKARKLIEEALTISRKLDDEKQIAFTLSFLSNLFLAEGEPVNARMPIEESLEISRRLGFKVNVNINLTNLGAVAYYEGDTEKARRHFAESLTIASEMGNKILVSCCLDGFAAISQHAGQAAWLAGAAESLREELGYEIELTERLFREDYLAKVRAALDEKTFGALYERGRALNFDEAVALAKRTINTIDTGEIFDFDETVEEIIVEKHSFSRIIIEEEIESETETSAFKKLPPKY